jgi:hypothetical protein
MSEKQFSHATMGSVSGGEAIVVGLMLCLAGAWIIYADYLRANYGASKRLVYVRWLICVIITGLAYTRYSSFVQWSNTYIGFIVNILIVFSLVSIIYRLITSMEKSAKISVGQPMSEKD